MSKYGESAQSKQWFDKILSTFKKDTGKELDEWIAIAKTCPETGQRKQLAWFKKEHGLLQNRAMNVLMKAFPDQYEGWGSPEKLVDQLFEKFPEQRELYETVSDHIFNMAEKVMLSPRKTYIPAVAKKQFAVLLPNKKGLLLGLALKGESNDVRLIEAKNIGGDRISYYLVLNNEDDFDDGVKHYLQLTLDENS